MCYYLNLRLCLYQLQAEARDVAQAAAQQQTAAVARRKQLEGEVVAFEAQCQSRLGMRLYRLDCDSAGSRRGW